MGDLYKEIPFYEWKEIDGKILVIHVLSVEGYIGLYGKDPNTGDLYLLAEKLTQ